MDGHRPNLVHVWTMWCYWRKRQRPEAAQSLLDCLALFCRLFGMEVNLAPEKTCMMVFRRPRTRVPPGPSLKYMGREVPIVDSYKYLGIIFSDTRNLVPAADALAASASRAMHVNEHCSMSSYGACATCASPSWT